MTSWSERADEAQRGLTQFFGADWPQFLNNTYPVTSNATFNYWWLAHVVDVRVDAYRRTGDPHWLAEARRTSENIRARNGGSLFNDYFDDMLWYALALVRLARVDDDPSHLDDARTLFRHIVRHGWNDTGGWSLAWRKTQLDYKNTPANAPLVILAAWLADLDPADDYLEYGAAAFDWLTTHLVGEDGFVADGLNRLGDGAIDHQWQFTYNQGLYIGAAVALGQVTHQGGLLGDACRTARTAIRRLSDGAVFAGEGDGGDEGLFKGIFYRYALDLIEALPPDHPDGVALADFIRAGTDELWHTALRKDGFLAGNDWHAPVVLPVPYSTQVSAIIALEMRARLG